MAQQRIVRDINQLNVLSLLRRGRPYSRAQLARQLNLTRSSVGAITADLVEQGLVVEVGTTPVGDRGGRPGNYLALNPRGASFLGAEFNDEHVTVFGMALDGTEILRLRRNFKPGGGVPRIMQTLTSMVDRALREARDDLPSLQGLGVSVPGMIRRDGSVSWLPGLHWEEYNIAGSLESKFGIPVMVENDANASAMAELLFGKEDIAADFLYLLLSFGVGSGIVIDHALYRGADGSSGEVGHMRLDPSGPYCEHCDGCGCLEMMTNEDALVRYFRDAGGPEASAAQVVALARESDDAARAALERWTSWLCYGLDNLIYIFNPGQIILGGTFAGLLPNLSEELSTRLKAESLPQTLDIRNSSFGEAGGAVGAAAVVYQRMFHARRSSADMDAYALDRIARDARHSTAAG